jgi:hypothetical protein
MGQYAIARIVLDSLHLDEVPTKKWHTYVPEPSTAVVL